MKLNTRNLVASSTIGGVIGNALTLGSSVEPAGVLLGSVIGALSLYASSIEAKD